MSLELISSATENTYHTFKDGEEHVLGRGLVVEGIDAEVNNKYQHLLSRKHVVLKSDSRNACVNITLVGANSTLITSKGKVVVLSKQGDNANLYDGDLITLLSKHADAEHLQFRIKIRPDTSDETETTKKPKLKESKLESAQKTVNEADSVIVTKKTNKKSQDSSEAEDEENEKHNDPSNPVCKYGATCYRKSLDHRKQYYHPKVSSKGSNDNESSGNVSSSADESNQKKRKVFIYDSDDDAQKPSKIGKMEQEVSDMEFEEPSSPAERMGEDDDDEAQLSDMGGNSNPAQDIEDMISVKPNKKLIEGVKVEIEGGSSKYEIMKKLGIFSCTCQAWKNQSNAIDTRTCKHLRDYLGEEFEKERLKLKGVNLDNASTGRSKPVSSNAKVKVIPKVLLAQKWEMEDPTGWWVSEKLDGVRAYWNGSQFISRLGNPFNPPEWFTKGFPTWPLDGELWCGRKMFTKTVSIVKSKDQSDHWKLIKYKVFDAPGLTDKVFEDRIKHIQQYFTQSQNQYVKIIKQEKCKSSTHLKELLKDVESKGGEGLMLRKSGSLYVGQRSSTLLKVKSFFDAEARVLRHEPGKGKHKGKCGALYVELPNGVKFAVGSGMSDKERENPPPIGSVITFRYQELSEAGVPRFPTYVGLRIDVSWPPPESQQIKGNVNPKKTKSTESSESTKSSKPKTSKPATTTTKTTTTTTSSSSTSTTPSGSSCLEGLMVTITGTHSVVRRDMVDKIQALSGSVNNTVTRSVDVVIATPHEIDITTNKVKRAMDLEIPIVSEQWLLDCESKKKKMSFQPYLLYKP